MKNFLAVTGFLIHLTEGSLITAGRQVYQMLPSTGSSLLSSKLDPCITFCGMAGAGDCTKVRSSTVVCINLCEGASGKPIVCLKPSDDMNYVTVNSAFSAVSTGENSCTSACRIAPGCKQSFCKTNNHCQALYWDESSPGAVCYHTLSKPCRPVLPVHCDYQEERISNEPPTTTNIIDVAVEFQQPLAPIRFNAVEIVNTVETSDMPRSEDKIMPNTTLKAVTSKTPSRMNINEASTTAHPGPRENNSTKSVVTSFAYNSLGEMGFALVYIILAMTAV